MLEQIRSEIVNIACDKLINVSLVITIINLLKNSLAVYVDLVAVGDDGLLNGRDSVAEIL